MPTDELEDVSQKLDDKISRLFGNNEEGDSAMHDPKVIEILSAAGVADPEAVLMEIEAAGFKIEPTGEPVDEPEADPMAGLDEPAEDMPADEPEDISKMPMKDARNSAAKFAFGGGK